MTQRTNGQTRARKSTEARIAKRRADALDLRVAGLSVREVADKLGVSIGTAHGDLTAALDACAEREAEAAARVFALAVERYNDLFRRALLADDLQAAIRAQARLDKLHGIESPDKLLIGGALAVSVAFVDLPLAAEAGDVSRRAGH